MTREQCSDRLVDMYEKMEKAIYGEEIDDSTGIAVDGSGVSTAKLSVAVMSTRSMPLIKRSVKTLDTYCEMWVSDATAPAPGREVRSRTSTKWGDLYPAWNENFTHPVSHLDDRFYLSIWDTTKRASVEHETQVGYVEIPLCSVLLDQNKHTFWVDLKEPQVKCDMPSSPHSPQNSNLSRQFQLPSNTQYNTLTP